MIGGYFGLSPGIEKLIVEDRIEAYNLPEGSLRTCTVTSAPAKRHITSEVLGSIEAGRR